MTTAPTLTPPQARQIIARHWPPQDMPYPLRHLCWRGTWIGPAHRDNALSIVRSRQAATNDPELALLHQFLAAAKPGQAVVQRAAKRTVKGLTL